MSNDLDEIRDRLKFCHSQQTELRLEERSFFRLRVEGRTVRLSDTIHAQARLTTPIPTAIRSRAGLIVHEARSCLDSLACTLAIRNGRDTKGTYFPISKSKESFESDGRKKIRNLSQYDQDIISSLTPYGGGDDFLFGMHEFDRKRKHIRLNANASGSAGFALNQSGKFHLITTLKVQELGDQWQSVAIFGPESIVTPEPRASLAFSEPDQLKGKPVIPLIDVFLGRVAKIVNLFDPSMPPA